MSLNITSSFQAYSIVVTLVLQHYIAMCIQLLLPTLPNTYHFQQAIVSIWVNSFRSRYHELPLIVLWFLILWIQFHTFLKEVSLLVAVSLKTKKGKIYFSVVFFYDILQRMSLIFMISRVIFQQVDFNAEFYYDCATDFNFF